MGRLYGSLASGLPLVTSVIGSDWLARQEAITLDSGGQRCVVSVANRSVCTESGGRITLGPSAGSRVTRPVPLACAPDPVRFKPRRPFAA
jgi:hypothetical protein